MATMLNGPFPAPTVGSVRDDVGVYIDADSNPDIAVVPSPSSGGGWAYKPINGSLKLNVSATDGGGEYINW